jgi:YD repeat-containing protein
VVVAVADEVCSARIETMVGFAEAGLQGRLDADVAGRISFVERDWDAMVSACVFRAVEGNPGPELAATMDQFRENEGWVRGIASALEDAPISGGISVRSSAEVAAELAGQGMAPEAGLVSFDAQEMVGDPVTSGFVNDPVNAATGNFVHADRDLRFPGFGAVLDVVRAYNSFNAGRVGLFGRGWTSLLDVALEVDGAAAGVVRLRFTDGAVVPFTTDGTGGWAPNVRRRMRLEVTDSGWRVERHNGRREWHFDSDGSLTGGAELAAEWALSRDGDRSITCVEARSGRWVRYDLTGGLVTEVATSDDRRCRYRYDPAGNCTAVDRAIGDVVHEIGPDGFLTALWDADGVPLFTNTYDSVGRVVGQVAPHGRSTRLEYLDNGVTRVVDDADGGASNLLFHDAQGNLTALFGADGTAMRARYDPHGRLVRQVARDGGVTTYEHHPDLGLDLITRKVDPDGLVETRDYDHRGRLVSLADRSGARYRYRYEGDAPDPSVISAPEGVELHVTHDGRGLPVSVVDGDGVVTRFEHDADGQMVTCTNGAREATRFTYDPTGQLTSVTDPAGHTVRFGLDRSGRVRTATDVAGQVRQFRHSPAGRVVAMIADGPGSWDAVYGDHGSLVSFRDASGAAVTLGHDACGRVTSVMAPDGTITTQSWDGLGQLTAVTDPAGNTATQEHDRAGRSVAVTRYDGRRWGREVDALGRTTALIGPDGAVTRRTYHPGGQLASLTLPTGHTWRYEVDGLGRLTAEIDPAGGYRRFEYSLASRLVRQTSPAGRVHSYRYDAAGRLVAVTDPDGITHEATIGPDGRITTLAAGGHIVELHFDGAGRVVGWDDQRHETSASLGWGPDSWEHGRGDDHTAHHHYDLRGLRDQVADPAGILTRFEHDVRGRVWEPPRPTTSSSCGTSPQGRLPAPGTATDSPSPTTTARQGGWSGSCSATVAWGGPSPTTPPGASPPSAISTTRRSPPSPTTPAASWPRPPHRPLRPPSLPTPRPPPPPPPTPPQTTPPRAWASTVPARNWSATVTASWWR